MYRSISPTKIVQARGERTRREVVARTDGVIAEQELYAYERGKYKPSDKKLPYLLNALGVTYDDISDPVELALS